MTPATSIRPSQFPSNSLGSPMETQEAGMAKSYHLFRDAAGYPRATFSEPPRNRGLIGLFLQMDVGSNVSYCERLQALTQAILAGQHPSWEGTGNLFTVTVTPDRVLIQNEYADDDENVDVSPGEFIEILQAWRALITG